MEIIWSDRHHDGLADEKADKLMYKKAMATDSVMVYELTDNAWQVGEEYCLDGMKHDYIVHTDNCVLIVKVVCVHSY